MTIQEIEQELFEMERKLKSMFNSCSQDLAIGIEKLRGELAELKESKKEGKWKPAKGDAYWFRDSFGNNIGENWTDCNVDKWRCDNIPIFQTKETCKKYWHFMDTVKEKSYEFSKEEVANEKVWKFSICYIPSRNSFVITHNIDCKYLGTFYFRDEESAQYIIDNFKDELMEYWI